MLATAVADLARASLVRLDAVTVRTDTTGPDPLPHVFVEAEATTDLVGLSGLLRGIEKGPLSLRLPRLSVSPQNTSAVAEATAILHIRFVVEGLALTRPEGRHQ